MAKDPNEARNLAGEYYRSGYNCAESIFLALRDWLGLDIPRDMVRSLTGFGGGLGHAGCMCGALAGSAMVLGLLKGRTLAEENSGPMYDLTREFHDCFENNFGCTCCRGLNPYPFGSREHLRNCVKITGNTGQMLARFIQEKGLD